MHDADRFAKGLSVAARLFGRAMVVIACIQLPSVVAQNAAPEAAPPTAFQPGDISIGEPIALPFAPLAAAPGGGAAVAPPPATAPIAVPGWLGMAVAESTTPGRWTIVELVPSGPAAAAGIASGDDLRGVNGRPLASADDVSAALTAITAGQQVRLSVARGERVSDIEVIALPRPAAPAAGQAAMIAPPATAAVLPPSGPAAGPGWQASAAPPAAAVPAPDGVATVSVLTNAPSRPAMTASAPLGASAASSASAPLTASAASSASAAAAAPRGRTALGVRTVPIDRDIQERFRLPQPAGAFVIGVVGDLPASKAGIPPGSVIVSLADRPVRSPQDLTQLVASGPTDRPLPLHYVLPGGAEKKAEVVLQALERPLEQALVGESELQPVSSAPTLQPSPAARTSRRPESPAEADATELRREVGRLRALLEAVERRLERLGR